MAHRKLRVLFLCVHNSARSQIAEGLLRHMAGEWIDVFSAGSEPSRVNPFAIRVLQDLGIDARTHTSKSVKDFLNQPFDYVITLCDEEICPVFPGAVTRLHWGMPDPSAVSGDAQDKFDAFHRTAAQLQTRVTEFLQTLSAPAMN